MHPCTFTTAAAWVSILSVSGYIDMSTSPECGFQFTARTSFTRTSERSWSLVQGQLNECLPTISRKI